MDDSADLTEAVGVVINTGGGGPSKQTYQVAITSAFLALSIPAVVLRIWVRRWVINALGSDDYMMILALISYLVYNASVMEIVAHGGGTHITDEYSLRAAAKWVIVNECFYLTTQIFLKLSLGLFFLRVVVKKGHRRFIIGTIAFCIITNLYHIFFVMFRCGDPRQFFEREIAHKCVSDTITIAFAYQQAAISTVTDLIFAVLPIPLLWNASMDLRSKIVAGAILSVGAFGCICSIVRFLYVKNLIFGPDFFWFAVNISVWSTIELGTGIVAGSLATLRPLLRRLLRTTRSHLTNNHRPDKQKYVLTKSTTTKPNDLHDNIESLPSVFRPWESAGESGGFTATIVGGHEAERDLKMSLFGSRNKSTDILSSSNHNNRAAIWPIPGDTEGISKVVDVQISISDSSPQGSSPHESERRSSQQNSPSDGGGLWGVRMEDSIRRPKRSATFPHSRSPTPEWERLPDFLQLQDITMRENRNRGIEAPSRETTSESTGRPP